MKILHKRSLSHHDAHTYPSDLHLYCVRYFRSDIQTVYPVTWSTVIRSCDNDQSCQICLRFKKQKQKQNQAYGKLAKLKKFRCDNYFVISSFNLFSNFEKMLWIARLHVMQVIMVSFRCFAVYAQDMTWWCKRS